MASLTRINIALDWEPNANHSGFYVALHLGFYAEAGIEPAMLIPDDSSISNPFEKVLNGSAQFALSPSQELIAYMLETSNRPLKAIATLLQDDANAIVTLKNRGLERPRGLDGRVYGSHGSQYEQQMVQQVIRNDGGNGAYFHRRVSIASWWDEFLEGRTDIAWIFTNVEGVAAALKGIDLNIFPLQQHGVPYGYSPIIVATETYLQENAELVRAFLKATAKGYAYMVANPAQAAALLAVPVTSHAPELAEAQQAAAATVHATVSATAHHAMADNRWGAMSTARWQHFLAWLRSYGLFSPNISREQQSSSESDALGNRAAALCNDPSPLFTNEYLPTSEELAAALRGLL